MKKFNCACGAPMKEIGHTNGKVLKMQWQCSNPECAVVGTFAGKNKAAIAKQINAIVAHQRWLEKHNKAFLIAEAERFRRQVAESRHTLSPN